MWRPASLQRPPAKIRPFPKRAPIAGPGARSPGLDPGPRSQNPELSLKVSALRPVSVRRVQNPIPGSEIREVQAPQPQYSPRQGRAAHGSGGRRQTGSGSAKGSPGRLRSPDHGGDGGGPPRAGRALPVADTGLDTRDTGRGECCGR